MLRNRAGSGSEVRSGLEMRFSGKMRLVHRDNWGEKQNKTKKPTYIALKFKQSESGESNNEVTLSNMRVMRPREALWLKSP